MTDNIENKTNGCLSEVFGTPDYVNKSYFYYLLHTKDESPVIDDYSGTKHWLKNGKHHREGDLPAKELLNGSKYWYKNGVCYRYDNWIENHLE